MDLLADRKKTSDAIAEGRYITHVLQENSDEINLEVKDRMSSFSSPFWSERNFDVQDNTLVYTTLKKHRFVDMKTRQTDAGKKRKKAHPIHNKPIFGHLNRIIKDLNHGFTEAVKQKFKNLETETNKSS